MEDSCFSEEKQEFFMGSIHTNMRLKPDSLSGLNRAKMRSRP